MFSRDLDSIVGRREAAAVQEFVDRSVSSNISSKEEIAVHVMRDHWQHGIGMLGEKFFEHVQFILK